MPQLQNLVLTDRAATPVAHTFVPRDITGNVGRVVESGAVPIGDSNFTIEPSRTAAGRYVAKLRLSVPVVQTQTINGVSTPTVVRANRCEVRFDFSDQSTEDERKNIVGMIQSALEPGKVLVNDTVVKLQGVY